MMKAQILRGINQLSFEDTDIPEINSDQVLVKVHAAGICGSDIPRIYQTGAHRHPLIPGHEFSGQVIETGSDTDKNWQGKRVGIFPLIPCKECQPCKAKKYEMCRNYNYLGSRCDGGFAEYVAVPEWNLIELPDSVTYEQAAMLEPTAVAIHAMRSIIGELEVEPAGTNIAEDQTLCICGLGTIGLLLAMTLQQTGYKNLLVIGNKASQQKIIKDLGVSEENYCDSNTQNVSDWIMDKTNNKGVDIFFECVGKNQTISQAIDLCAPSGKLLLLGNPYSDMTFDKNTYWKILRNQLTVKGTWNSSFTKSKDDDWNYAIKLLETGKLAPEKLITHCFSLEDLEKGLHIMRDKSEDYVKIMCRM